MPAITPPLVLDDPDFLDAALLAHIANPAHDDVDVVRVHVAAEKRISMTLLVDPEHNLDERVIKEQFQP